MPQPANPLLDAIDDLTIVHIITTPNIPILDGTGKQTGEKTHYEKHDGLIKQLREAIASDIGGTAAGKPSNERIPLDADALQKYEQIEKAIGEKYVALLKKVPGLYPEKNLREWYIEFTNQHRAGKLSDETYDDELKVMQSWVRIVTEKLSPPTILEIPNEQCPECGFDWYLTVLNISKRELRINPKDTDWVNKKSIDDEGSRNWVERELKPALTVTFKPDGKGGLSASFAKCGCCNHVWLGSKGIRALAYEIETPTMSK